MCSSLGSRRYRSIPPYQAILIHFNGGISVVRRSLTGLEEDRVIQGLGMMGKLAGSRCHGLRAGSYRFWGVAYWFWLCFKCQPCVTQNWVLFAVVYPLLLAPGSWLHLQAWSTDLKANSKGHHQFLSDLMFLV